MAGAYDFYQMMGYPTPYYKEFFAYETEIPHLGGGQKLDVSRGKINPGLQSLQQDQREIQHLGAKLPFLESIYITGDVSANATDIQSIDLWIVISQGRYYLSYVLISLRLWRKNIRRQRMQKLPYRLSVLQSEQNLAVPVRRLKDDPVRLGYMLLHLIPLYIKHENISTHIYDANPRLSSFFPQFSGQSIIGGGCETVVGSGRTKKYIENILSAWLGKFFDALSRICYHISARILSDTHVFFLSQGYRKFPDDYESLLLKWKAMKRK